MNAKLLTWPLAFLVASTVMVGGSLAGLSTPVTAAVLAVALVVFVAITLPVAEGLGPRDLRRPHRRTR